MKINKLQQTSGGTYAVYLPADMIRRLGWRKGDHVIIDMTLDDQGLTIKKVGSYR